MSDLVKIKKGKSCVYLIANTDATDKFAITNCPGFVCSNKLFYSEPFFYGIIFLVAFKMFWKQFYQPSISEYKVN
jgi:hypothetical protein